MPEVYLNEEFVNKELVLLKPNGQQVFDLSLVMNDLSPCNQAAIY